ncbi:hypothetical protein L6164_029947 [Bauhinia variegata]|uniref:Uncharacterized protein n=1 Tax=Bauhinia variegata TaxID=167791 RepID=A0ACB9LAN8_BAUVA|nr:hypothetical protein L6164_029947 [Bauhinia variegata]
MNLFQSEVEFIKALKRFSGILLVNTHVVPNIKVLSEVGVPEWNIVKIIEEHPWALKNKHDRFKEIIAEVTEMGLDPLMAVFVSAVGTIASVSKFTWTKKVNLYKKWGWSDDELLAAFGKYPKCITVSEDKIEKIMDFIVNEMGYESSKIARNPVLLGMSFNKRILPRGSVFRVLLSKGLVKKISLSRLFFPSEKVFLEKFITHHENEANELFKLYQAKMYVEE